MGVAWFLVGVALCFVLCVQESMALRCQPGEFPSFIVAGSVVLDISGVTGAPSPVTRSGVSEATACQQECDKLSPFVCVSFSFSPVTQDCILYPARSNDAGVVTEARSDVFHYVGICSKTPNLENCTDTNIHVDLAFIVDGSGSICDGDPTLDKERNTCQNWRSVQTFLKVIINFLTIGSDTTRVSLVTFANEGNVEFHLNRYTSKSEIEDAIDNLVYPGGNTNTYEGLNLMRRSVFNTSNGDRPNGRDVALVITDGFPTFFVNETAPEALAAQEDGIIMYAVGITNKINEEWLKIFSSAPKELNRNYFTSPDFNSLQPVITSLLSAACIRLDPVFVPSTVSPTTKANIPETTQNPDATTSVNPDDDSGIWRDIENAYDYLRAYPEYAAMIGMGIMIILLFVTSIIILCCYTSRGAAASDKYRDES